MASGKSGSAKWGKRNKSRSSAKARRSGGGMLADLMEDSDFEAWENNRR